MNTLNINETCINVIEQYIDILEIDNIKSKTTENDVLPLVFIGVIYTICEKHNIPKTDINLITARTLAAIYDYDTEYALSYIETAYTARSRDGDSAQSIAFYQGVFSYEEYVAGDTQSVFNRVNGIVDHIADNMW